MKVKSNLLFSLACIAGLLSFNATAVETKTANAQSDAAILYKKHCMACHGPARLGGMGPALLPENLSRLRPDKAIETITNGRIATQMPAFGKLLSEAEIAALTDYIFQPPTEKPHWTMKDIVNSHVVTHIDGSLPDKPLFEADLQNLFIVVELGDHHATLLNGDTFDPIHRFATRYALHGGPKYSPDGRYVYFASRDGWITKYDIYNLKVVSEIRAAINTRNLAISSDGKYAIAGNYLPHNLVLLDAKDLSPIKIFDVSASVEKGEKASEVKTSRVSAVYTAPPRNSFIAALKDLKEVWEIPYDGEFEVRRIKTDDYLDDFFFDPDYKYLIGASRESGNGQVIDMEAGKKITDIDLDGMPHLGSGINWEYNGKPVLATPHLKEGKISIIDMETWNVIKKIETLGPGFFMRSHENSPYAWVDVFFGPHKEAMHIIDKSTLEIKETLRPVKDKTAAHVEFTKDGKYALLSIWDEDGALIIYDSHTLKEIKRLPMKKPSGKYNVYNKTHYAQGTSH